MRKTILVLGLLLFFTSCNSSRVEELVAENEALRLELIEVKIKLMEAQRSAEEQTQIAQMQTVLAHAESMRAKIAEDSANVALARLEAIKSKTK